MALLGVAAALALTACDPHKPAIGVVGHVRGFAGLVAADEPRAALVAQDVLAAGGSAADAAIALYFTMAVTLPSSASLGGGGICVVHDTEKRTTESINFLSSPSAAVTAETTRPSAVPGNARGMFALHAKYGKLRWEGLLGPAEALARFGTPVSRAFATDLTMVGTALLQDREAARILTRRDGTVLREGDVLVQPDLAGTLSRLRSRGVGDFYVGAGAADFTAAVHAAGGSLSVDDLRGFMPAWGPTVAAQYGDYIAHFAPPPAAGGVVAAQMWTMLTEGDLYEETSPEARAHLLSEASSRAFLDRARWMAADGGSAEPVAALTSKQRVQGLLAGYSPERHAPTQASGLPKDIIGGTGFVVADPQGMAVACSLTMNHPFGTGRIAPATGVMLAAAPGKDGRGPYPLAPMIVVNRHLDDVRFAAASSGGITAPGSIVATAAKAILEQVPLADALAATRVFHGGVPDVTFVETGFAAATLESRGHQVSPVPWPTRVNALSCPIGKVDRRCAVGTDPRGAGLAIMVGKE